MQIIRVPKCPRAHGGNFAVVPEQIFILHDTDASSLDVAALVECLSQLNCARCNAKLATAQRPVLSIPRDNVSAVISALLEPFGMGWGVSDFSQSKPEGCQAVEYSVSLSSRQPHYAIEIGWSSPATGIRDTARVQGGHLVEAPMSAEHSKDDLQLDTVPHLLARAIDGVFSSYGFRATQRGRDASTNWIYLELWRKNPTPLRVRAKLTWPVNG